VEIEYKLDGGSWRKLVKGINESVRVPVDDLRAYDDLWNAVKNIRTRGDHEIELRLTQGGVAVKGTVKLTFQTEPVPELTRISSGAVYWNESNFKPRPVFYYGNAKNSKLQSTFYGKDSWKDVPLAGPLNGDGTVVDTRTIGEIGNPSGQTVEYRITFEAGLGRTEGSILSDATLVCYTSTAAVVWYYPDIVNILAEVNTALGLKLGYNRESSAKFWCKIDGGRWIENGVIPAGSGIYTEERSFASLAAAYPPRSWRGEHKITYGTGEQGSQREVAEFDVSLVSVKPWLTLKSEKELGRLGPSLPGHVKLGCSNADGLVLFQLRAFNHVRDWGAPVSGRLEDDTEWEGPITAHRSGTAEFRLGRRILTQLNGYNAWYSTYVTQEKVEVTYTYDELAKNEADGEVAEVKEGGEGPVDFGA
jgi:hypothetical protein